MKQYIPLRLDQSIKISELGIALARIGCTISTDVHGELYITKRRVRSDREQQTDREDVPEGRGSRQWMK